MTGDSTRNGEDERRERGMNPLGWGSLTPAEVRVAELAMQGLTNPEIGEQLGISKRTVGSHLSGVYGKLAMRGRIDLILRGPHMRHQTRLNKRP